MNGERINSSDIRIAFFTNHGPDAMAVLRVLGPAKMLGIEVISAYQDGEVQKDKIQTCNIFIHQRDFCKDFNAYETMVSIAHEKKVPIIFDLDDLLFELPENHPDRKSGHFSEALLPMYYAVLEADVITVSTQRLAEYLLFYNKNVHLIPNYLNDEIWNINPDFSKFDNAEQFIIIGYMGGHSHKPDILMVLPVLRKLLEKYPERLRFKFWGITPPDELEQISKSLWNPPPSYTYVDFAAFFQKESADIVIAPLQNDLFNSCKSPIKFLEYSANLLPGVYSNLSPYTNVVTDGYNGMLAISEDDWLNKLSILIEHPELRSEISKNALITIKNNWLLSRNLEVFENLYSATKNNFSKNIPLEIEGKKIIQSVIFQTLESFHQKNWAIKELESQTLHEKENNSQLQNELSTLIQETNDLKAALTENENRLISISLSKSWRITRPFRSIHRRYRKGSS